MSGGHWDYKGAVIRDTLTAIGEDPAVKNRFPKLARLLPQLAETLAEMEHMLDWDLSGDEMIASDTAFQRIVLEAIEADLAFARKESSC